MFAGRTYSVLKAAAARARQEIARKVHQAAMNAAVATQRDVDVRIAAAPKPLNQVFKAGATFVVAGDSPGQFAPSGVAGSATVTFAVRMPYRRSPFIDLFIQETADVARRRMADALRAEGAQL